MPGPDGRLIHAEIKIGNAVVMITDEMPEMGGKGPQALGGTPVSLMIYSEDSDALSNRAVAASATVRVPMEDAFWGDRWGSGDRSVRAPVVLRDPQEEPASTRDEARHGRVHGQPQATLVRAHTANHQLRRTIRLVSILSVFLAPTSQMFESMPEESPRKASFDGTPPAHLTVTATSPRADRSTSAGQSCCAGFSGSRPYDRSARFRCV
jgi:hypothetical protein